MLKLRYIIPAVALALFSACSDSKDNSDDVPQDGSFELSVETEVALRAAVKTEYSDGDAMNVYAKAFKSVESENRIAPSKAERNGGNWTISPRMWLKEGQNAFMYAVSPYNAAYTDPAAIPVNVADQIDLLCSGTGVIVNGQHTKAILTMRHAFALVSFNIQGPKAAELQSISITGDKIYTSATLNAEKRRFTGTDKTQFTLPTSATVSPTGWSKDLPQMWFIPFSTKEAAATLTAVIDGKTYMVNFPEIEMSSGNQYIFRLVFSDYGLEFIASRTEVIALDETTDVFGELENYGELRFTVSSPEWTLPLLTGNNVFGKFSADGRFDTYSVDNVTPVKFSNPAGPNVVGIETWNSTGFELNDIKGVNEIDLTNY